MSDKAADRARAQRIAQRIRSQRAKGGRLSIYARLNEAAIENAAEQIARSNPYRDLDEDALTRSLQRFIDSYPDSAVTAEEMAANLRAARQIEATPVLIRDPFDRRTLARMTPMERLNIANGAGVSHRFKVLGPDDAS